MLRINLSFIFDLECFKVDAERVCYHMVDCCQKAIADSIDRVSGDGFSLSCKPNEVVKRSENRGEFIFL